ncbi:MAG: hypothetical protein AAFY72_13605 [Cyanobacteria bacterium J06649_4]
MLTLRQLSQRFLQATVVSAIVVLHGAGTGAGTNAMSKALANSTTPTLDIIESVPAPPSKDSSATNLEPAIAPEIAEPITLSIAVAQLSDLRQFPLFLPETRGTLITTDEQLSTTDLSQPSLFRIQAQLSRRYESANLVEQWQAYEVSNGLNYIDVVVNESLWQRLNYFRKYAFVSQLGTTTRTNGYHLRIFHSGDVKNRKDAMALENNVRGRSARRAVIMRGAYFCDFQSGVAETQDCEIVLRR